MIPTPYRKYRNVKTPYDGRIFDSKAECNRYIYLKALEKKGDISNLECQKKFILIPTQREPDIIGVRGGHKPGALIFPEISYRADFVYYDNRTKQFVVEDVKGMKTPEYKLKAAMMLYLHHIRIKEIVKGRER